ncbi:MAG: alkaline phosphatase D family protein [Verrucomicrobiota bacterium]
MQILASGKKPDSGPGETLYVEMLALLAQDKVDEAEAKAREALAAGLPAERFVDGSIELLAKLPSLVDGTALVHGPMLGDLAPDGVSVWVRTRGEAEVTVKAGGQKAVGKTAADRDFTTVVRLRGLSPATEYSYEIAVDGKVVTLEGARFTTAPASGKPGRFAVGFGGGGGFIPEWEGMWDTIRVKEPTAFLMLGDNVYIDDPKQHLTHHYCYSRRQARPEWRRLTALTPIYSIWDDHDFGLDDCVPGPEIDKPTWKRGVWEVFRNNWVNPAYGGGEKQPGCWHDFQLGDVHFLMLDGRYYRDLKGGSMLGPVQKAWLKERLTSSSATFKVIASPVPFSEGVKPGSKDTWDGFPNERAEIFSWIAEEKIEGVFLIAADRHRTDLRRIENPDSYTLYEFMSSRLTNRHTHPVIETDGLIWGYSKTCSFGLMHFDTTKPDPEVRFELIDIEGTKREEHLLKLSGLRSD